MTIVPNGLENVLPLQRPDRGGALLHCIPDADHFVRVPDDKYIAEFIATEGFYYRGLSPKIVWWFLIAEGQYEGNRVAAYYNATTLDCRPSQRVRQPKFTVGWRADLTAILAMLFPDRYSHDDLPTEIPESEMAARRILIQTRTSKKTHKGQQRPEQFHSSVVDSILGWGKGY